MVLPLMVHGMLTSGDFSLLSRAHSNYLAQINIRMNERAEKTNDVLGKLTVLGTIVLPMNIVTGMWGMNGKPHSSSLTSQSSLANRFCSPRSRSGHREPLVVLEHYSRPHPVRSYEFHRRKKGVWHSLIGARENRILVLIHGWEGKSVLREM
jgi:CorA-like Mg2+ transporter protein